MNKQTDRTISHSSFDIDITAVSGSY